MKIVIGSDPFGFTLKQEIKNYLLTKKHEVVDVGGFEADDKTPYYTIAHEAALHVQKGKANRGVLICSTGIGSAIIANKHSGIYAAACTCTTLAERSRTISNTNVLALGSHMTTSFVASDILDIWLDTEFAQGWNKSNQGWLEHSIEYIAQMEATQLFLPTDPDQE